MLKLALCDDDPAVLNALGVWTRDYNSDISVDLFASGAELMNYAENTLNPLDILVCDIHLGLFSGIDISSRLKETRPDTQIIFISGEIARRIDVYRVEHVYFLPKPISKELFYEALDKCAAALSRTRKCGLALKTTEGVSCVYLHEIDYIEQQKRVSCVYTRDRNLLSYGKLQTLLGRLDGRFCLCHKSYAVNMDKVREYTKTYFQLQSGVEVPISRACCAEAKQRFLRYIGRRT